MKGFLALVSLVLFTGCTYSVHQVNVSDFYPYKAFEQGKAVTATAEQSTFLGWVGQTDYINEAYRKLIKSCPGGIVSGITTEISTAHGFFSWTNKVRMQGLCIVQIAKNDVQTGQKGNLKKPSRRTSSEN